jgi:hypothetical protein
LHTSIHQNEEEPAGDLVKEKPEKEEILAAVCIPGDRKTQCFKEQEVINCVSCRCGQVRQSLR